MRWPSLLILISYNLLWFINQAIQGACSAFQPFTQEVYPETTDIEAPLPSLMFLFIYLPLGAMTAWVNARVPVLVTMLASGVLMLASSLFRSNFSFGYPAFLAGAIFASLAQPWIENNQSLLSQRLISPDYQGTYNGFVALNNGVATAFGWLTTVYFVTDANSALYYLPKLELAYVGLEVISIILLVAVLVEGRVLHPVSQEARVRHALLMRVEYDEEAPDSVIKRMQTEPSVPAPAPRVKRNLARFSETSPAVPFAYVTDAINGTDGDGDAGGDDDDQLAAVTRKLEWFAVHQGVLNAISTAFNNTLQLLLDASPLNYTDNDVFWSGFLFFIPIVPVPMIIGYVVDRLRAWGRFSLVLLAANLVTTMGVLYTVNVNKYLFFVFLTLYSITAGTILTSTMALSNVVLDDVCNTRGKQVSAADGDSDEINTVLDWVTAVNNALLLLLSAYLSITALNAVYAAETIVFSILAAVQLLRIPQARRV